MEETIELNEIIKGISKGKWIIITSTIVALLFAAIVSWFVVDEQYESGAVVQVAQNVEDTGILSSYVSAEFTPSVFMQRMKKEALMNTVFKEAGYGAFIKSNLTLLYEPNTQLIELTYKASTAEDAQQHLSLLLETTKADMNASLKDTLIRLEQIYLSDSNLLANEVEQLIKQYNNVVVSNKLPEVLILQTVATSQIVLDLTPQQIDAIANITGTVQNELIQLRTQIDIKVSEYSNILTKYQSVKTGINNFSADPFIRVISEPTLKEDPISPNKALNLVIGLILGAIIGLAIVLIRMYMGSSKSIKK